MSSLNTVATRKATRPITHEGAPAATIGPIAQLRRSVMACMLWEQQFYEDGISIADRIHDEVNAVLRLPNGGDVVANIAFEARTKMNLRHVPLLLAVAIVAAGKDNAKVRELNIIPGLLKSIIQRPDELSELVAIYWRDGKVPLTNQMKKGLAAAFDNFGAYQLAKYATREGKVRLRDVLFLCHAKAKDEVQANLWKDLADDKLVAPDTWESQLSAGNDKRAVFTDLIMREQLGGLALLRNLRGMTDAGVDLKLIRTAIREMKTDRILPFRFIAAARYAPQFEPELEMAMFRNLAEVPKLAGNTLLLVDVSGSMDAKLSSRAEMSRWEAACALAMLVREIGENVGVLAFDTNVHTVPPRRGFGLRDAINKPNGGTDIGYAVRRANAAGYDRIIVFTDEQSATAVPRPVGRGYMVNVASAQNGVGYGEWVHFDGFSEALISFIQQSEAA